MFPRSDNSDRYVTLGDVAGTQTSNRRHRKGWFRVALLGTVSVGLLLTACGDSDDDTSGATTAAATEAQTGDTQAAATDAPSGASGTATFTTADLTIDGVIVSCSSSGETDVDLTAEGETSSIQVTSTGDGSADVVIGGAVEWEGRGQVVVSDAGAVTITGTGSAADAGAQPEDFTLDAQIDSC